MYIQIDGDKYMYILQTPHNQENNQKNSLKLKSYNSGELKRSIYKYKITWQLVHAFIINCNTEKAIL